MRNDAVQPDARIVVIGVPGSRRVTSFCDTAQRWGFGPVDVVSYLDLIQRRYHPPTRASLVRLESPGECAATMRAILRAGIAPIEASGGEPISAAEIDRLACDRGEMLYPRQWFFGYREILRRLNADWSSGEIRWMSQPAVVITAFDKIACLERWSQAALPIPRGFRGIASYQQLREEISRRHARLFIKLRYGYSAMGAVALEWRDSLVRAITTVEIAESRGSPRLFVSKWPRVLTREAEIAWLIDTLAAEEIVVEQWLPKARYGGRPYDVRVVMVGGKVQHVVGRANDSPFTNLNLDATRIPREQVQHQLGEAWPEFENLCQLAASLIPDAGVLGLDVLIRPCRRKFALLEANAFGDYLPGLLHCGQSTYEIELQEFCVARERIADESLVAAGR